MPLTSALILAVCATFVMVIVQIIMSWDWSAFWTALGAIATFVAVLVALWLPYDQEKKRQRDENAKMRFLYADIFFEIDNALKFYVEVCELAKNKTEASDDLTKYLRNARSVYEKSLNSKQVLRHLLRRDNLADGVIRRAVDAMDLNRVTANAAKQLRKAAKSGAANNLDVISSMIHEHEVRHSRILDDLDGHRIRVGLDARKNPPAAGGSDVSDTFPKSVVAVEAN